MSPGQKFLLFFFLSGIFVNTSVLVWRELGRRR